MTCAEGPAASLSSRCSVSWEPGKQSEVVMTLRVLHCNPHQPDECTNRVMINKLGDILCQRTFVLTSSRPSWLLMHITWTILQFASLTKLAVLFYLSCGHDPDDVTAQLKYHRGKKPSIKTKKCHPPKQTLNINSPMALT